MRRWADAPREPTGRHHHGHDAGIGRHGFHLGDVDKDLRTALTEGGRGGVLAIEILKVVLPDDLLMNPGAFGGIEQAMDPGGDSRGYFFRSFNGIWVHTVLHSLVSYFFIGRFESLYNMLLFKAFWYISILLYA